MRSPQNYSEISKKLLFFKNLLIFLLTLFIFCFFRNCVVQSISVWKWNICDIGLSSHRGWRKPRRLADCSTGAPARWRKFCQTVWLKFDFIQFEWKTQNLLQLWLVIVVVGSSGILKAKQKLGVTFNFDKQDVIDFTKFSKMTRCRASEPNS